MNRSHAWLLRGIAMSLALAATACGPSEATTEAPSTVPPSAAGPAVAPVTKATTTPPKETEAAPQAPSEPMPEAPAQPTSSRDAMCDGICARAAELRCPKANDCPKMCAETMKIEVCNAELAKATDCVLARPATDWQCTAQGVASIKDPFCTAEQKAFGDCLIANSPKR
jgi:hypothetical protein